MSPRTRSKKTPEPEAHLGIHAVVGSEESEVKRRAKELALSLAPKDAGDFGIDQIDGAVDNSEQAVSRIRESIQAIQTLPFFGNEKLVWLKDVNFLGDTITGRANAVQEALEDLRSMCERGMPEGVKLLISASDIDKRRGFYKALSRMAQVETFERIDTSKSGWEEDAQAIVHQVAAKLGLQFAPEALELFVQFAGADARQIRNELEKIALYLGPERLISEDTVSQLVAKTATGVIWELGNTIAKRDLQRSLALLDQLLFQGETAIGILYAAITPTVRNLVAVKELLERNKLSPPSAPFQFISTLNRLPESATRHLPRKKDGAINAYALGIAACDARRFSLNELRSALKACLKANLQLVTTQLDPRLVLSQLVVTIVA
jgi:DNA polymerase III subunit delta